MEPSSGSLPPEFHADDGTVVRGPEAIAAALRWGQTMQAHNRRVVERMTPFERHRLARQLATGRRPTVAPRAVTTTTPKQRDRERRPARRSSSGSRTSGSDPGDDGDPEPAPPASPDPIAELFDELRGGGLQLSLFGRSVA